jgi:RimJ/RimL family protein N-acetyltransferase
VQYLAAGPAAAAEAATIATARIADFEAMWAGSPGYGPWAAIEKSSGQLVGHIGLRVFPEVGGATEVLYMLDDGAWGKGYATEGATAARDYGFEHLELKQLVGLTHPDNLASQKVLEKIGMQRQADPLVVHGIAAVFFTLHPRKGL